MSFIPAVQREITSRPPNDPVRMTLEYMLQHAVGRNKATPLATIVAHLRTRGLNISDTAFQQSILAASRSEDYFIGSGHHGYFLIESMDDAAEMRDFYETRIQAEQQNLANLRRQGLNVGWSL